MTYFEKWLQDTKDFIKCGRIKDLHAYLLREPPSDAWSYRVLFEANLQGPADSQDKIDGIIFEFLDQGFVESSRKPGEPSPKRARTVSPENDQISVHSVFEQLLLSDEKELVGLVDDDVDRSEAVISHYLGRNSLALKLWEREGSQRLLHTGLGVVLCAHHGRYNMLKEALARLEKYEANEILEVTRKTYKNWNACQITVYKGFENCFKLLKEFGEKLQLQNKLQYHIFDDVEHCPPGSSDQSYLPLLHVAIRRLLVQDHSDGMVRRIRSVDFILDEWPRCLAQRSTKSEESPFQQALSLAKDDTNMTRKVDWEGISQKMKNTIFEKLTNTENIRKALYKDGPQETGKEFALDLSDFDNSKVDFAHWVANLEKHSENSNYTTNLEFEETLIYLILPDLNNFKEGEAVAILKRFFSWLGKQQVERIMYLSIPDSHSNPLPNEFVTEYVLKKFKIVGMNWRRLDVNLDVFLRSLKLLAELKSIELYSSGTWGYLHHWVSKDGLWKITKLEKATINLVGPKPTQKDFEFPGSIQSDLTAIQQKLESRINRKKEKAKSDRLNIRVEPDYSWKRFCGYVANGIPEELKRLEISADFKGCHDFLKTLEIRNSALSPRMQKYAEAAQRRVKVAIIDNGIDNLNDKIAAKIQKGVSFTNPIMERDRTLPWFTAADGHGTQMAYLVQKINPYCRLLPIRAGRQRNDIDVDCAINAIDWALAHDADVISISWIPTRPDKNLRKKIRSASKKALIICTTADRGVYAHKSIWPKRCCLRVSAADVWGHPRPESEPDEVDFMLPGHEIHALGPSYIEHHREKLISGSSVATALASGIASLSIYLARLNDPSAESDQLTNWSKMLSIFEKMYGNDPEKLVRPSKLFNNGYNLVTNGNGFKEIPEETLRRFHVPLNDDADVDIDDEVD